MRLSAATLDALPPDVTRPGYDRVPQSTGIVHFGIGAFHRAHQAWYTDAAMNAGERDWMIAAVSLRSGDVAEQLNPQDGLYTVTERLAGRARSRVVGSVREVLVAPHAAARIANLLGSGATRIVSFTVTEKGYCRLPGGGLDTALAAKGSFYPLVADAFRQRRAAGLPGLTLLSCDNLASNGAQIERLMREYLADNAPDLIDWFAANCSCPSTMVDRIVPATTAADLDAIEAALGKRDEAAVVTEPFSQWVIEDKFAGPRPAWERHGAQFTSDVRAYETAKLRMLNGAHSALAYLGLQRGHEYVHQAIVDPELASLIDRLMRQEAATSLTPAPGQDLDAYADALIARFENPALDHRLAQIAMDGSQKVPQRWLETLAFHQQQGRECPAILAALGGWLRHIRGGNGPVDDPMAAQLRAAWEREGNGNIAQAVFGKRGLIASPWQLDDRSREALSLAVTESSVRAPAR